MGGAGGDETPPLHGLAQAVITAPSQRRLTHGSRALVRPLLAHMHPASCQLFSWHAATRGTGTCAYFLFMRSDTYAPRDASQGDPA